MDTLQNIIKAYLDDTGLSISAFSRQCDISKAYMSMLIRNKDSRGNSIKPSIETLEKIAEGMRIPFEDLFSQLRGDTAIIVNAHTQIPAFSNIRPIETKRFPVLGEIACGTPIFMDEERELYIESGANIHADFCLIARGDSMINARINDGDIVFIQKDVEIVDGQIYAVAIDDEATLKRLYYDRKQNILQLLAENPKYSPMVYSGESLDHIHVLGRAVAFQSDVK